MADMTTACLGTLDMSLPAAIAADRAKDAFTLHVVHGDCARCARRGGCANPLKAIEAWRATLSQLAPRAALEIHAAPKSVDTGRRRFWGRLLQKAELGLEADEPFDEASARVARKRAPSHGAARAGALARGLEKGAGL